MVPEGRDEVRRRIDSLYEHAENATGNYNATRAMSAAARNRGVALAKGSGRRPEPGVDAVARQWFDMARASVGPTVPAVLPADRLPAPPAVPARSWDRADAGERDALSVALPELAPGSAGRAVAELTSGPSTAPYGRPRAALEAGPSGPVGTRPALPPTDAAERPAALASELPSAPAELPVPLPPRPVEWGTAEQGAPTVMEASGPGPAGTAVLPVAALPVPPTDPARMPRELPGSGAAPRHPSPADSKTDHRRKLAAARDLLARRALKPPAATTEFAAPPEQWQQPWWTAPSAPASVAVPAPSTDTGSFARPLTGDALTDTYTPPAAADTFLPAATSGSLPPPSTTGAFPLPSTTGAFATATSTGPLPSPTVTTADPLPPVTFAGSLPPTPATSTGPLPPSPATGAHARSATDTSRAARAIAFARAQIGKPCVWGATGPGSYDCSSLTRAAWQTAGVALPRAAHEQALAGTPVTLAALEPGDLVLFFDDDRHVGLHVGDGLMIHAPGPGSTIREESVYGAGESAIHRVIRPV
ncbi:NlpC/P60 family protein [Streptomyces sp. NPDC014684]|uniref:C40 family peptidase n=1 Tax=Streptomyces sp. NPDC014684 TaxID=3364880 RepID=UPI0036F69C9B